jgi:TIR domain
LTGALVGWTIFADIDLSVAKGLESVNHGGPSTIGIDTLYRSNGQIPDVFLRGAGVPDTFITYVRSLVGQAIEFYSCFISYSSKDQEFAERLHADLQNKGVRCWFAPEDLKIGDRFQERIEETIRVFDKVMIILSESSVQSRWVEREVNAAREREDRDGRTVLFPVRIDEAVKNAPQPWTADVRRSRHIGDFRRWKDHDAYQAAFKRLLRDLKASEMPRPAEEEPPGRP